jgi:hypothetical protein
VSPAPDGEAAAALLRAALDDAETGWSLGSFGALATFRRDPDEPVRRPDDGRPGLATERGAIALTPTPGLRPLAYETAFVGGWNHAVALCLPEGACAGAGRRVVTECGPDGAAVRAQDRDGILFDLGLGLLAVDACVRTRDPALLALLRAGAGRPLFEPGNPLAGHLAALSPHRVFVTRPGRIEVFAPIPRPGTPSPPGPHTHLLPGILEAGRTHPATAPIPEGFVPCGALHPPHPAKDAAGRAIPFDHTRHEAFQRLLDTWGDPLLVAAKRAAEAGEGASPAARSGRHLRAARRAAEVQARVRRDPPA